MVNCAAECIRAAYLWAIESVVVHRALVHKPPAKPRSECADQKIKRDYSALRACTNGSAFHPRFRTYLFQYLFLFFLSLSLSFYFVLLNRRYAATVIRPIGRICSVIATMGITSLDFFRFYITLPFAYSFTSI